MTYDRALTICVAGTRDAKIWTPTATSWAALAERLRTPQNGTESHAAYLRMTKAQQDALKDVGGFLGGTLRRGRRKIDEVTGRDLLTLDLDAIPAGGTDAVLFDVDLLDCAACVYSTRKHDPDHPRLRVIIPLSRTITGEEYEPAARQIAGRLGIEKADPTCFRPNQMMYWPNVSADSEYIYETYDKPLLDPDALLSAYTDWRNAAEWPALPGAKAETRRTGKKQQDPEEKTGIVGAFCRCYDIRRAMDELLPGTYVPTEDPTRYTYARGSTTGGAIIYEDKWLYSHHATDPTGGQEVNAWDLVRLHRFGDKDEDVKDGTPGNRLPSYNAMRELALTLDDVRLNLAESRITAADDFAEAPADADANAWKVKLQVNANGAFLRNAYNVQLILHEDPELKGKLSYNTFRYAISVDGPLPWNKIDRTPRDFNDADDACLRNYFDLRYAIEARGKIGDVLTQIANEHRADDVRDYLNGLPAWDGVKRVDTLLIKYLLADDTPYNRAVTRKTLVAAVARAMEPGCKFDNVLTLVGAQGSGKSMFADIMGGHWYNDSLQSFNNKDAMEMLRGSWIIEIPEVDRFSTKFDSATVKQFITRRDDIFRESYGHRTAAHPRRCVFIATTNTPDFLTDTTGNRRWWIVPCRATSRHRGADMDQLRKDRDQVWAEALELYQLGEDLTLDQQLSQTAETLQDNAQQDDGWRGMIAEWLEQPIPKKWANLVLESRMTWWEMRTGRKEGLVERETVCVAEVWCELMQRDKADLDRLRSRRISAIIRAIGGWEMVGARYSTAYGMQKTFRRKPKEVK